MSTSFVYDQSAFESFCAELVRAGFSPTIDSEARRWTGPVPDSLRPLTDASTLELVFRDGWPAVAARVHVPGLVADHVMPKSGYICLWADDDPAQVQGQTWTALAARLDEWAQGAQDGFRFEDRALDAWAVFPGIAATRAELDLGELLGTPHNGDIHVVHGRVNPILTVAKLPTADHTLQGVVMYRNTVRSTPRSLDQFETALTRRQRENLTHGLSRRAATPQGERSGGYDFAVLAWPKYGQLEALVLSFAGAGPTLEAFPHATSPSDVPSRLRRAGADASLLQDKRVLIAGVGAVGGQVAVTLASSGVRELHVHDDDELSSVNLARHVLPNYLVGFPKTAGVKARISGTAPWCEVEVGRSVPLDPEKAAELIRGFNLVVDCTGMFAATLSLALACEREDIPMLSVALFRGGRMFRLQRQLPGDVPILQRAVPTFPLVPPAPDEEQAEGFLELGCTAPVHNAPPAAVLRASADAALAAVDLLAGRPTDAAETLTVLQPIDTPPFDTRGSYHFPLTDDAQRSGGDG